MESNLSSKAAQKLFDGEGGSCYVWSSAEFNILNQSNLGGRKLILQPLGLALPHYADSSKIGYVLQVGIISSRTSEEKVFKIKKGDVVTLPLGVISWWFNHGDSGCILVFLGETSKAHQPGQFTYFFLEGTKSTLNGFSTEFVSKAWNLNEEEANKLIKSQGVLIIKLNESQNMPKPNKSHYKDVLSIDAALLAINGGRCAIVTRAGLPLLGQWGLVLHLWSFMGMLSSLQSTLPIRHCTAAIVYS